MIDSHAWRVFQLAILPITQLIAIDTSLLRHRGLEEIAARPSPARKIPAPGTAQPEEPKPLNPSLPLGPRLARNRTTPLFKNRTAASGIIQGTS